MTQILSKLKKSGKAAALALALGTAAMSAVPTPVLAQSAPSFDFRLDLGGNDRGLTLRFGNDDRRVRHCLTNAEVRRGLRVHGFRNIDIVRERNRNRVEVVASYGNRWYRLVVNKCTGRVQVLERIRRGVPGGFGLQFNFGM
ncbi:hypothetical protein [Devosia sp.]|uniref:hypothetical protein n=1 Tax=Devosia sp. TaxID=1871048 RepID=UPI002F25636A